MLELKDPVITAKLLNHPEYRVQIKMPPKPKNKKMIELWEIECAELKKPISFHNSRLRKKIFLEMLKEES